MSRLLGIDPGLHHTGWGVVQCEGNHLTYIACGTITTNAKTPLAERLKQLSYGVSDVIKDYAPDMCAIEETFVNKNPLSSLKLGHARGAVMLSVALADIPLVEYAATLVKKSVVGVGRADKNQVITMIKQILPQAVITSEDAADALAVAVCHAGHRVFEAVK